MPYCTTEAAGGESGATTRLYGTARALNAALVGRNRSMGDVLGVATRPAHSDTCAQPAGVTSSPSRVTPGRRAARTDERVVGYTYGKSEA